jgi:WD40 repeat protein
MRRRCLGQIRWALLVLLAQLGTSAGGQGPVPVAVLPPGDEAPLPRLEVGGPTSLVTGLAFSPDGQTLYEAGWDKVVRVWRRDARSGAFVLDPRATYRVPIGPGTDGAINALAVSPDGTWLAVAGNGIARGSAGFRQFGVIMPAAARTDAMRADQGLIYVFNTRSEPRSVRLLRGNLGPVLALAFVAGPAGAPARLVSAARERESVGAVRVWDVEQGKELRGLGNLPDPRAHPGLTAWSSGPGPAQIRVAIAWGDGSFRLWDLDNNRLARADDGRFNTTLVGLGGARLLTGSLRRPQGRLTSWQPAPVAGEARLAEVGRPLAFVPPGGGEEFPDALALVAGRPGGPLDHAAVVVLRLSGAGSGIEARLKLLDLNPRSWGTVRAELPLAVDPKKPPQSVLAADLTGRSLAVVASADRRIAVYSIADVLQGRSNPQTLRGAGVSIRTVGFVKKGQGRGLRLSTESADLILDAAQSRLTPDLAGWNSDDAAPGDWRTEVLGVEQDDRKRVVRWAIGLRQGEGPERRITLERSRNVTATAVLPPQAPWNVPVVAVAYEVYGEPGLDLYNGQSGEPIRQFSGHAESIRSLAFSSDGRLLVSAAHDQMVCLWSLTDLDKVLGERGGLAGLVVKEANGALVVARLEPDSPGEVREALREGDAIQGLVVAGNLRPLSTVSEFYLALSQIRPGTPVTIRRARGNEAPADRTLRLGQGIDERKPLLSLFVTRGAGPGVGAWSWVGWNPLGPYEASDPGAERRLGWHFNTGQPEMPVRFALADQYRKFRRDGLLNDLIGKGVLTEPVPPPPPPPVPNLTFDPEGVIDGQGRTLVRRAPENLVLTLLDQNWTADAFDSVHWSLDGGPEQPMEVVTDRTWTADLSQVAWARGLHRVVVTLVTHEATPREFKDQRLVRFVPPPPTIRTELPVQAIVVTQPEFRFQAKVSPSLGPVKARLIQEAAGRPKPPRERSGDGSLPIDEPLTLERGINTIKLAVENAEALRDDQELETTALTRIIVYNRVPARPPDVVLEGIRVLRGGSEAGALLSAGGTEPIAVTASKVQVEGRIAAVETLSEAQWSGEPAKPRRLTGFTPGREPSFAIRETIDLAPGINRLRFQARAADSEPSEALLEIDYRPPVPELADLTLEPSEAVIYGEPGAAPPRVRLRARLNLPADRRPYEAAILVNDEERPGRPVIDEGVGTLTAEIPLQPLDNHIRVRLRNAWGASSISEPVSVEFRRPPRVVALETSAVGDRPFLDLTARVESPDDRPPTRAQVVVKGRGTIETVIDVQEFRREGASWVVSARGVPLSTGENTVQVWAWNLDGRSQAPESRAGLVYTAPPPPKAEVEFLRPGSDTPVKTRRQVVEFRVRSPSPLTKVRLLRVRSDSDRKTLYSADVAKLARNAQGVFEVHVAPEVILEPQVNRLLLVAVNAGGERAVERTLSYLPPPVLVEIDQIKPKNREAPAVVPTVVGDNRLDFAQPLTSGRVTMYGRVIWTDEGSPRQKKPERVQVWVNGLPQLHVALQTRPGNPREGTFEASIQLRLTENQVEIKVPKLAREAGDQTAFRLLCTHPENHQRLHLLIVGVGVPKEDASALRDSALKALQGTLIAGSTDRFKTPAYGEGIIYGPLVAGNVTEGKLMYQVAYRIRRAITPLETATDVPNEVVMIYFQGGELVEQGKSYLRLGKGRGPRGGGDIPLEKLAAQFTGTRGAHLWLLDVTRSEAASFVPVLQAARWPGDDDVPIGLLRFAWVNPIDKLAGEPPVEAPLLNALRVAVPLATTVGEVTSQVSEQARGLNQLYPNLTFDSRIPEPLADLRIGNRP